MTPSRTFLVLSGSFVASSLALADHPSWNFLGYWDLQDRLGAAMPTGAGVVVGQVEAGNGQQYLPNTNEVQFDNLIITPMSGAGTTLNHANTVGKFNYGSDWSIAPARMT